MKKFTLVWVLFAALIAIVTTVLEIQPALTFIHFFAGPGGSYNLVIPVGLSFIILVIPLFFILFMYNLVQNRKNKLPADLTGKTGIVVKREKELTNAALMYDVYINGEKKMRLGMGKSVFIELEPGTHSVQTRLGKKIYSPELSVQIETNGIRKFYTKTDFNKSMTTMIAKGEMLLLVQV